MRSVDRNRRRVRRDVPKAGVASDTPSGTFLPPSTFSPEVARTLDRMFNAGVAGYSMGLDPRVFALVALDWWVKLSWSPGTHARLTEKALRKCSDWWSQYHSDTTTGGSIVRLKPMLNKPTMRIAPPSFMGEG